MTTTYIAVCPHHCDSSFITEAEVTQKWEVDSYGECIRVRDEDVSTELPYTSSWKCSKCGAKAEEYQCARFEFKENGLNGFLLVPRDTLSVGYLFWDDQKSGVLRSLPIAFGPDRTLMATWIGWGPEIIERQYKKATNTTE